MISLSVSKLAKFFDKGIEETKKILIVSSNGTYELFGRFKIESNQMDFHVTDFETKETVNFSSLKYAVAWCVFLGENKYMYSKRLQLLDLKLSSLKTDIAVHRKMLKASIDEGSKLLYKIKLQQDSYKRKEVIAEIEFYINNSKKLQGTKFNTNKELNFKYL